MYDQPVLTIFILVIATPISLGIFTATFAALGIRGWHYNPLLLFMLTAGIFLGSATWGPIIAIAARWLNDRELTDNPQWINQVAGVLIVACGICLGIWTIIKLGVPTVLNPPM